MENFKQILKTTAVILALLPSSVLAHDADHLCPQNIWITRQAICVPENTNACTKNPLLQGIYQEYWHARRGFVKKIFEYAECIGKHRGKGRQPVVDTFLLNYWDFVPATPIVNECEIYKQCSLLSTYTKRRDCRNWALERMYGEIDAAVYGRDVWAGGNLKACEASL